MLLFGSRVSFAVRRVLLVGCFVFVVWYVLCVVC